MLEHNREVRFSPPPMHSGVLLQPPRENHGQSVVSLQQVHLLLHLAGPSRDLTRLLRLCGGVPAVRRTC